MAVHSALGNGFHEVIYQRALQIEMADRSISFSREYEMPIYYKASVCPFRAVQRRLTISPCDAV